MIKFNRSAMRIWLDDERPAPQGWVHAKTAAEAIHLLESMHASGL